MAAFGRPENPAENLAAPPTGLPVPNQGGIPQSQNAPQRPNIKPPIVNAPAGPPGPEPQPLPIFGYIQQAITGKAPQAQAQAKPAPQAQAGVTADVTPIPRLTEHKLVATRSSVPDEHDLDSLDEGEAIATTFGEVYREPGGRLNVALNETGKVKYEQARTELRKRVGWVGVQHLQNDPNAPQLEMIPGMPVFNPFAPPDRAWTE